MKTEFAKEKSEYSHLLMKSLYKTINPATHFKIIIRMKELEEIVKSQGDELSIIVTTVKTNPMKDKSAPPMTMEKIKNG